MTDVDDLIQRHQRRLAEHKRYLDAPAKPADSATAIAPPATQRTPPSRREHNEPHHSARSGTASRERGEPHAAVEAEATPRYYTTTPTKIYDRSQRWVSHRNKAIQREVSKHADDDLDGCTFHPSIDRAAVSESADPTSPSFFMHVQRQHAARRDRDEAQRRTKLDTSRWTGRPTAVKEFSFGKGSEGGIAALKKPITSTVSWDSVPTPREAMSARGHAPRQTRADGFADDAEELMALREGRLQHEHEVAKLNGTITSLRRELDVAKGKIRQLALTNAGN
jgi:hypothetical protein